MNIRSTFRFQTVWLNEAGFINSVHVFAYWSLPNVTQNWGLKGKCAEDYYKLGWEGTQGVAWKSRSGQKNEYTKGSFEVLQCQRKSCTQKIKCRTALTKTKTKCFKWLESAGNFYE